METVAARHHVAAQLLALPVGVDEADHRGVALDPLDHDAGDLEADVAAVGEPGRDEVLHDLLLPVDGDALADEAGEVDPVVAALEAQRDPLVRHALAVEPLGQPDLAQQLDGGVFQHPRAHPLLDVGAAARLQHDGLDPGAGQQV